MRNIFVVSFIAVGMFGLGDAAQGEVVFRDNFEYAVGRNDTNAPSIFISRGWNGAKTQQTASGAKGYLYTTTNIPGFTGPFPGANSSRVLAIEALPGTFNQQTDFYLELGDGGRASYDDFIPGDVWFQFWVYSQDYGDQRSTYPTRSKFFYVCNTAYPCHSHLWMIGQGPQTYDPSNWLPLGSPSQGEFFFQMSSASGASVINYALGDPYTTSSVGSLNASEWVKRNRWTLVKMHFNTTRTSGNSWEVWMRPYGGAWTKVSEWIGGRTPGFTWDIPSASVGGHRVLRMPSTVGREGLDTDYWMYMDDFVIATSESDLPVYPDVLLPNPPSAVNVD